MPADLRELLDRTAASPTAPVDPARIASRSRRRTRRRRGSAGLTGVALVALLAVVAWPGAGPGDGLIIEDRVAGQPEVPVLDLPEGWVQVQVGDAVFGIPDELEVVEIDADDPLPCDNSGNRAYLATETYPAAIHDPAGNEYGCNLAGNTAPQLFAAPLSAVPAAHLGGDPWNPRPIGGLDGEWRLGKVAPPDETTTGTDGDGVDAADDGLADRTAWYRVPVVDLHLRFVTTESDVDLVEAILATITPVGDAAAEALDGAADDPAETTPAAGDGPTLELPEGWTQVTVGDATFGVPNDLDTLELTPADGPPCHNGIDGVRTYLAPDGYPTAALQDRDPGGLLPENTTHVGCRYKLAHYTSLLAAPLGTVPVSVREQQDADAQDHVAVRATDMTTPGGLRGERIAVGDHLVTYALPQVDLWLEFHNPQQDSELADQVLATVTPVRPLEDVVGPDAADGDDVISILPGTDARLFETPGRSLPPGGHVISDPGELDALWSGARSDGSTDDGRPVPTLRDGEIALLARFTYASGSSCRGEVDLTAVEIEGQRATIVFEPSLREPCIPPAGSWTVAVIVPADARGVANVTTVTAIERG